MFANGRRTIGVFISQDNSEFQRNVSLGISSRAKELDYNVAFFTNFGYGESCFCIGERSIADLPIYEDLDGIVIVPETMAIMGLEESIREHINNRCKCPVVSIRRNIKEYYNVLVDDDTVLEEIIRHFIEVHGFTRLNFLAGPKGYPDSEKRLNTYKNILQEHNIEIEEDRIFYGDFWKTLGYTAVEQWLSSDLERPQAIICANDYMAITVCNALAERGIQVPEDIAVSGCDDIEDALEYMPSITTARMPVVEMGIESINKIHTHIMGIKQEKTTYLKTVSIYRESCGCKKQSFEENVERKRNHTALIEALDKSITRNAYMSTELTGLTKLDKIEEKLPHYVYDNTGFDSFYMCLSKDWESFGNGLCDNQVDKWDEMLMSVGIRHRVDLEKVKFNRRELIPEVYSDDSQQIFYFTMLHHQENCFGYTAISFNQVQTLARAFQAWMSNVNNALENVRIHGELNRLVYKLEDMYVRDELTGLYNRRGLEILGKKYLKQCVDEKRRLMVLTADMDKLKLINDNYGHACGDIAIKAIADALQEAADDDEICMRISGDEFTVVGLEYDENKIEQFITKFVNALDDFNKTSPYEFKVYVSYGWSLILPDENTTMEECMIVADSRMYQQKYEKESLRLRSNIIVDDITNK